MEQQDRDLLITMSSNVENLTSNFTEFKDDNKKEHDKFNSKLDCITIKKISNRLFFWVIGIIVLVMLGSYTYSATITNDLSGHKSNFTIHKTK